MELFFHVRLEKLCNEKMYPLCWVHCKLCTVVSLFILKEKSNPSQGQELFLAHRLLMLVLMTKRRCQSLRFSHGHLNYYILCCRKQTHASVQGGRSQPLSFKTQRWGQSKCCRWYQSRSIVKILPALDPQSLGPHETLSRHLQALLSFAQLLWECKTCHVQCNDRQFNFFVFLIFYWYFWIRTMSGRCHWRHNNLMRTEGSSNCSQCEHSHAV